MTKSRAFKVAESFGKRGVLSNATQAEPEAVSTELTVYANTAAFPTSGNIAGAQAFSSDNNKIYVWNGAGWFSVATVNQTPTWSTEPDASYVLATDGTATTITVEATDPDGFPITYGYSTSGLGSIATISQGGAGNRTFTITPSTNEDHAGSFTMTFTATDGVNSLSKTGIGFSLTFSVPTVRNNHQNRTLWLGTGSGNNTTINDTSDSNHTLTWTKTYNMHGSYSPYRPQGYSFYNYLSGTAYYATTETHADFTFGTGDYTIDMWVYRTAETANEQGIFQIHPSAPSTDYQNSIGLGYKHSDTGGLPGYYLYGDTSQVIHKSGSTPLLAIADQTWTHIAITRTSNVQKLFVDGVQHVSRSDTKNYTSNCRISIGTYYNTSSYIFRGFIAGFRVIKGTSLYSADFVPDRTAPDPALTNTKFYYPYNGMLTRDYHGKTITPSHLNNDNGPRPKTPYDGIAYDPATHGGSIRFLASEWITAPSSADFAFGTGDFTIEGWANHNGHLIGQNRYIFDLGSNGVRIQCYNETIYAIVGSTQLTTTVDGVYNNCWWHFAMVRSSGTLKLYINGRERGSSSDSTNLSSNQPLNIGRYGGGGNGYFGYIADFRIVKGTAVYTGAFSPPIAPVTKTGGTYLSTTNVNTNIPSGHTKLLVNLNTANIINHAHNGNVGIYEDVVTNQSVVKHAGKNTIYFDGNGNQKLMNDAGLPQRDVGKMLVTDFTMEMYVRVAGANSTNNDQQIYDMRDGSSTGQFVWYYSHSQGKIHLNYLSDTNVNASFNASYNTWYHVALVRHNFYCRVYVDGVQINEDANSTSIEVYYAHVGKRYTSGPNAFNGHVYNLRYSGGDGYQGQQGARYPWQPIAQTLTATNSTRADATVTASNTKLLIGHAATIVDGSSVGATISNNGSVPVESTIVPASGMKAVSFNGSNQYLHTPANTTNYQVGTGQFMIEAYIYVKADSQGAVFYLDNSGTDVLGVFYYPTYDCIGVYDSGWLTGNGNSYPNRENIRLYRWCHIALCRDASHMRLFVNGKMCYKATNTTNYANNGISIGRRGNGGVGDNYFTGHLSNVRFVKGESVYTETFTPPTTELEG